MILLKCWHTSLYIDQYYYKIHIVKQGVPFVYTIHSLDGWPVKDLQSGL